MHHLYMSLQMSWGCFNFRRFFVKGPLDVLRLYPLLTVKNVPFMLQFTFVDSVDGHLGRQLDKLCSISLVLYGLWILWSFFAAGLLRNWSASQAFLPFLGTKRKDRWFNWTAPSLPRKIAQLLSKAWCKSWRTRARYTAGAMRWAGVERQFSFIDIFLIHNKMGMHGVYALLSISRTSITCRWAFHSVGMLQYVNWDFVKSLKWLWVIVLLELASEFV